VLEALTSGAATAGAAQGRGATRTKPLLANLICGAPLYNHDFDFARQRLLVALYEAGGIQTNVAPNYDDGDVQPCGLVALGSDVGEHLLRPAQRFLQPAGRDPERRREQREVDRERDAPDRQQPVDGDVDGPDLVLEAGPGEVALGTVELLGPRGQLGEEVVGQALAHRRSVGR
jgi:hypothetical protein